MEKSDQTCRVCGFEGPEVAERRKRWAQALDSYAQALKLCDLCAALGSLCNGGGGHEAVTTLSIKDLIQLLHQVIIKIKH